MITDERCLVLPGTLAQQVGALWRRQGIEWGMLGQGLASLRSALTRTFDVAGSRVVAQCNAARVISASARVDPASLAARPCFLCEDHLPPEQRAIPYGDEWLILCNPAPLFDPHFTVVSRSHDPQRIDASVEVMLDLARDLGGRYTIFYNGPKCGASAPDHLHFQASPVGATPFESELATELCTDRTHNGHRWLDWVGTGKARIGLTRPSHRPSAVFLGRSRDDLTAAIQDVIAALGEVHSAEPEPMLNLFVMYVEDRWIVWLYPRKLHRPSCYGDAPDRFLISPGSVDLAGLLITPRRADFDRLSAAAIGKIYEEVMLGPGAVARLRERIAGR